MTTERPFETPPTAAPQGPGSLALWVTPVSNLAGVARHILDAARVGIPCWRMEVAAPDGPLLDRLRGMGIPVHPLPLDGNPAKATVALRQLITDLKPQAVHSHLAKADLLLAAAGEGLPTKRISSEHGIAADARLYNRNPLVAKVKQQLHTIRCNRFDHLIAVSASTKEQMLRQWRPKTPITVVLNGVDRPSEVEHHTGKRYLSLSRLSHEKNIAAIIEAFAELDDDARLTVAGDGPDRPQIAEQIRTLGLRERVSLPGFVAASEALAEHDVLVQLSKWENASSSLLDAVVHGLGVVATPVGGNPEILPERCLVEAENTYEVARLMREQADPAQHPVLPESWPTVAEMTRQIADVYDEVWR